jgi:DHA1 family inner membrane transport protein
VPSDKGVKNLVKTSQRNNNSSTKIIIISLTFSSFATYPNSVVSSLLLVDIARTFNQSLGVMAQIRTISSVVGFIAALSMGALSVRYKPKTLLMLGLSFLSISAFGSSLANNLLMIFALYAFTGLGTSMVEPMVTTLIGDNFPVDKRTSVIGWAAAGGGLSYIIGSNITSYIANLFGWQSAFFGYAMIVPIFGLLLSFKGIPVNYQKSSVREANLLLGFQKILSNKSAIACLLGNFLASSMGQGIYFLSFSYLRDVYHFPPHLTSLIFSLASVCFFIGSILCGKIVTAIGRKQATVATLLTFSLLTITYPIASELWYTIAIIVVGHFFAAVQYSASNSLSLEQIPEFRGSMMSINSAAAYLGYALGSIVGGVVLLWYGWSALGLALGVLGILASALYHYVAIDPN